MSLYVAVSLSDFMELEEPLDVIKGIFDTIQSGRTKWFDNYDSAKEFVRSEMEPYSDGTEIIFEQTDSLLEIELEDLKIHDGMMAYMEDEGQQQAFYLIMTIN